MSAWFHLSLPSLVKKWDLPGQADDFKRCHFGGISMSQTAPTFNGIFEFQRNNHDWPHHVQNQMKHRFLHGRLRHLSYLTQNSRCKKEPTDPPKHPCTLANGLLSQASKAVWKTGSRKEGLITLIDVVTPPETSLQLIWQLIHPQSKRIQSQEDNVLMQQDGDHMMIQQNPKESRWDHAGCIPFSG